MKKERIVSVFANETRYLEPRRVLATSMADAKEIYRELDDAGEVDVAESNLQGFKTMLDEVTDCEHKTFNVLSENDSCRLEECVKCGVVKHTKLEF